MDGLSISLAIGFGVCMIALAASFTKMKGFQERASDMSDALSKDKAQTRDELEQEREKASKARANMDRLIEERTEATTKLREVEGREKILTDERNSAYVARDEAIKAKTEAERNAALKNQEMAGMQKRMDDWETAKAESLEAAKAATVEIGTQLSSKLLADHKRESDAAKKETREEVQKTTENLLEQVKGITNSVAALNEQVSQGKKTIDTVMKAISSPGGSGQFAQIGLENTLKQFGLVKERDFFMDKELEGKKLRPDAIVLLPGDTVFVIDSKASKFLVDLAEAEGREKEESAYKSLASTMNRHLSSLAGKNYKAEIVASYREAGRTDKIKRTISIMWLPNEGAVEKVAKADPEFVRKAAKQEIFIAGPSNLACLIGFARVQIDFGKQAESHEQIVSETKALLDSVGVVIEYSALIGTGLRAVAKNYVKLAGSINSRLLPRVRTVASLGVRSSRSKGIPKGVPQYQVVDLGMGDIIEGEVQEIQERPALTNNPEDQEDK